MATRQQDGAVAPRRGPDGLEDLERRGAAGERPPADAIVSGRVPDEEETTAGTLVGLAGMERADRKVARHVIQNPTHDSLPQVARRSSIAKGAPEGSRQTAARETDSGIAATSPPSSSRIPSGDTDYRKTGEDCFASDETDEPRPLRASRANQSTRAGVIFPSGVFEEGHSFAIGGDLPFH